MNRHTFLPSLTIGLVLAMPHTARAGEVALGLASVQDPYVDGHILGGHLAAAYRHPISPQLSIEGRVGYIHDDGSGRPSALSRVLPIVFDNELTLPIETDIARAELLLDIAPERYRDRLQGIPHLRVGLGAEVVRLYSLSYASGQEDLMRESLDGTTVRLPVTTEFTHELWGARGFGLRFAVGALFSVRPEPLTGESTLTVRPRVGVDLLFDTGGRQ
jgi:hypothetical protein